jgi:signal transduction histidine kinase
VNAFEFAILLSMVGNVAIGLVVYLSGPHRVVCRAFALMSAVFGSWLLFLWLGATARTEAALEVWIRACYSTALFFPLACDVLRHAITDGRGLFVGNRRRMAAAMALLVPTVILCWTRPFIQSVALPTAEQTVGIPNHGWTYPLYPAVILALTLAMCWRFARDLKAAVGVRRVELQFSMMGSSAGMLYGIAVLMLPAVTGSIEIRRFLPTAVLVLDGFIAYGIATRRIMGVSYVLHRMAAYAVMAIYLSVVYAFWLYSVDLTLRFLSVPLTWPAGHFAGTVAVVVCLLPIQRFPQRMTSLLLAQRPGGQLDAAVEQAGELLQRVTRVDALLPQFCGLIEGKLASGPIAIYLAAAPGGDFLRRCPEVSSDVPERLPAGGPLVGLLSHSREVLSVDTFERSAVDDEVRGAARELALSGGVLAMGVYGQNGIEGVVVLPRRLSGGIYDALEQRALRLMVDPLGVAIENARLYTAIQDGKAYTDQIVNSLMSGLVVSDPAGKITLVNQRFLELLFPHGDGPEEVLSDVSSLPAPLSQLLQETLNGRMGVRDRDVTLARARAEDLPVRVSTGVFRGHDGAVRGGLLMMHDMTELRRLEEQVRRTDRLSSIGTLSAGMAHEIKNPLVSIKTFTQLLPERYTDAEFRQTFFDLIGQEVTRIDNIVNRLLGFARPAEPSLVALPLHQTIDASLHLVSQQAKSRGVELVRALDAFPDRVMGDADLLRQAFLNLFLNAIEAMEGGGTLTVSTRVAARHPTALFEEAPHEQDYLAVSVRDTGTGIRPEHTRHIFDPFFTTKSTGTGLGLSVAHGIFQEHRVAVDMDSKLGQGTTFTLVFPLAGREEPTA